MAEPPTNSRHAPETGSWGPPEDWVRVTVTPAPSGGMVSEGGFLTKAHKLTHASTWHDLLDGLYHVCYQKLTARRLLLTVSGPAEELMGLQFCDLVVRWPAPPEGSPAAPPHHVDMPRLRQHAARIVEEYDPTSPPRRVPRDWVVDTEPDVAPGGLLTTGFA